MSQMRDHLRRMARYNAWKNAALMRAADGLDDAARWTDRGAFFGSIAATFNHLLWDDQLWLARFQGYTRPERSVPVSLTAPAAWGAFQVQRVATDARITAWADGLTAADLQGQVAWYPGGGDVRVEKPAVLCMTHLFNHQTHHRGQIHAMLTAAGVVTAPTDLPMLPEG